MPWWAQLLVGLVAIAACVVGVIMRLWKDATPENHHWRTCKCERCTHKRNVLEQREIAEQKRRKAAVNPPQPHEIRAHFISTAQLEEGMFVRLHEEMYLVKRVHIHLDAYIVYLRNVKTRIDFEVTVAFRMANQKMWEPAEWWRRS